MTSLVLMLSVLCVLLALVNAGLVVALLRLRQPARGTFSGEAFRLNLEQMERRLMEIGKGIERMSRLRMYDTAGNNGRSYELAHRMASRGASVEQVALDCGLSFEEAELIVRLHRESQ